MHFCCFWNLKALFSILCKCMDKSNQHSLQNIYLLCSTEERNSYRFGTTYMMTAYSFWAKKLNSVLLKPVWLCHFSSFQMQYHNIYIYIYIYIYISLKHHIVSEERLANKDHSLLLWALVFLPSVSAFLTHVLANVRFSSPVFCWPFPLFKCSTPSSSLLHSVKREVGDFGYSRLSSAFSSL